MREKILRLQSKANFLEPSSRERISALRMITDYTENFLNNIDSLPAYNTNLIQEDNFINETSFKDKTSLNEVLDKIKLLIDTPGLNPASGGHLGYIPGGGLFYSAVADYLASLTNRYSGVRFASPGAVLVEETVLHWMANLFGFPSGWGGTLTSGGSLANLAALATARDAHDLKSSDYHKAVIYVTQYAHHCLQKSIRIIGMADVQWREIECDSNYKMDVNALRQTIEEDKKNGFRPWLLVASAGTTDVGAIDPLEELSSACKEYNLWFHVDAAYGGFFMLTDKGKQLLKGIENADSLVADPHKGLFIPYGLGALLVKKKKFLHKTHYYLANYMQDAQIDNLDLSPADLSSELSRHFRGLRLWLPLKLHGVQPFKDCLDEKLLLTEYCYQELAKHPDIELFNKPELSVFAFRFKHDKIPLDLFNEKIQKSVMNDGRVFITSTKLNGSYVLRFAVLSFRTHLNMIDTALESLFESKHKAEQELLTTSGK